MDPSHLRYKNRRPNSSDQSSTPQSSQFHLSQSPSLSSLIPGSSGVVQSAMRRKILDRQSLSSQESPIATQEYIRRAIEDPMKDEDFQDSPWLSAMEFLTEAGTYYPLRSIKKKCHNIVTVDQVVIIKSCTPNGLDDLMVTLKDPMDTIGASVHRKVLTESEFASDIYVGFVLILQKVVVFAPTRSACYLNITLNNVFKVFPKNNEVK